MALQIATMKEENSHEVASIKTKQDKINEKQNNMDDLRKKLEATEAEIANLKHRKSQEFIQMKKKQDVTFEMEKKHAQMENMKLFMKDVKVSTGFTLSAAGWPLVNLIPNVSECKSAISSSFLKNAHQCRHTWFLKFIWNRIKLFYIYILVSVKL